MNTKLLINGKLVAGKGEKEDVLDPATGKSLASVAEASEEQIGAPSRPREGVRRLVATRAEGPRRPAAEARRPHRGRRLRTMREAGVAELRQAATPPR